MIQPSGSFSPRFRATRTLPSALIVVAMSRTKGASGSAEGTATTMGLVERRWAAPPKGATAPTTPCWLEQTMAIMPARAACSP